MPVSLNAYCDVAWGSYLDESHSTSGAFVFIGDNSISWWAKKQPTSINKAEYRSLALDVS